jgi:hypothetical protein
MANVLAAIAGHAPQLAASMKQQQLAVTSGTTVLPMRTAEDLEAWQKLDDVIMVRPGFWVQQQMRWLSLLMLLPSKALWVSGGPDTVPTSRCVALPLPLVPRSVSVVCVLSRAAAAAAAWSLRRMAAVQCGRVT